MHKVDTRGKKCPVPIIETRKALKACPAGETFEVVTDDRTAFSNISRFLKDNNLKFSVSEEDAIWTFLVTNSGMTDIAGAEETIEPDFQGNVAGDFAVVISSEMMGQGDDGLGLRLMKSFFIALSCLDSMPTSVMFYNSGVKLTVKGSEVIEILHEIESKGVEILICGTCVDHYKLGNRTDVGVICDMYQITRKLAKTGNIIRP
jgi:selenium metabolism protein YedF